MTPLRDVIGLGLMIPLLVGGLGRAVPVSRPTAGARGSARAWSVRRRSSRWATIGWGSTALYALYRFVGLVTGNGDLPMGGCVVVEAAVVPGPDGPGRRACWWPGSWSSSATPGWATRRGTRSTSSA